MHTESVETRRIVYDDEITRAFVLASVIWGLVALALGALVATQISFWQANFDTSWFSFGRASRWGPICRPGRFRLPTG